MEATHDVRQCSGALSEKDVLDVLEGRFRGGGIKEGGFREEREPMTRIVRRHEHSVVTTAGKIHVVNDGASLD